MDYIYYSIRNADGSVGSIEKATPFQFKQLLLKFRVVDDTKQVKELVPNG